MPIQITMPRLSDTMETGTIIKWNVKEGDTVSSGDVVADIETDKATMEMTAYDDGTVASITVPEGKPVPVGTVIAVLNAAGESGSAPAAPSTSAAPTRQPSPQATFPDVPVQSPGTARTAQASPVTVVAQQPGPSPTAESGRMRVSPVARNMAEDQGIDLGKVEGTGPGGRIIKRDILAAAAAKETGAAVAPTARRSAVNPLSAAPAAKPSTASSLAVPVTRSPQSEDMLAPMVHARRMPLSNMRQVIAKRLVESKTTIPHYQVTMTVNMDPLLDQRKSLNDQLADQGVKLSVNDFLVRACAIAMHRHPEFNASWGGDSLVIHGEVNIGVAIALPPERGGGLVVATIRNADQKSLRIISYETKVLSEKARTRGLTVEEMADSTFTISNLGMFGVDHFTAIINPPNSAIMAVGGAIEKPVVRDHQLTVGHEMSATLSCDHRVIDGATAAQYLLTVKSLLEQPATLLV